MSSLRIQVDQLEELPTEVFDLLTDFLSGFDLLKLSNASPALYRDQLNDDNKVWKARASGMETNNIPQAWLKRSEVGSRPPSTVTTVLTRLADEAKATFHAWTRQFDGQESPNWKKLYLSSVSLRFPGREDGPPSRRERGGGVEIPPSVSSIIQSKSFSVEIWFALQPSSPGDPKTLVGGVVLGAQSKHWAVGDASRYHQSFIHVDPLGRLYCSLTDSKEPVAEDLELGRWYHLVLTYDASEDSIQGNQRVYINGRLVDDCVGSRHPDMRELRHMQLGTGCMSANSPGKPTDDHVGWYGFDGLVADCRVWDGILSPDEVSSLLETGKSVVFADVQCVWSLMDDPDAQFFGPVKCARTPRPNECYCMETFGEFQLPGPKVPYIFRQVPRSISNFTNDRTLP